jgi:hypothetical protein
MSAQTEGQLMTSSIVLLYVCAYIHIRFCLRVLQCILNYNQKQNKNDTIISTFGFLKCMLKWKSYTQYTEDIPQNKWTLVTLFSFIE